jgi:hypothetical protein
MKKIHFINCEDFVSNCWKISEEKKIVGRISNGRDIIVKNFADLPLI